MLFNSYEFIFAFIPLMLMLYILSNHYASKTVSLLVLVLGSLFFYGWWNPTFVLLISCSILFNFYLGRYLANSKSKLILIFGITSNLLLIGYFKYFNFFGESLSAVFNSSFNASQIILPLAISFFTFQQIAFLVDCYKNKGREDSLLRYSLFITFFPQLIAGPIVHHKEMLPQFEGDLKKNINTLNILIGLSIFSIGLFKKTVIADGIAPYANAVFYKAGIGGDIGFFEAWSGALAYTFQLYFDFSGYSDMALGIARMFGIILPLNFYSPYKASNISEFWRRWHMTLSRFLRDYLYIALGGNRQGPNRRQINLIITMLLGGLWHGAGWNFVIWGGLHGLYLVIFHVYSSVTEKVFASRIKMPSMIAWTLTFLAVVLSWVFFRATTPGSALTIINGMVGINGVTVPNAIMANMGEWKQTLMSFGIMPDGSSGSFFVEVWIWNVFLLCSVILLPNVYDLFKNFDPAIVEKEPSNKSSFWPIYKVFGSITWTQNKRWVALGALYLSLGMLTLNQVSEFLYFQF